MAKSAQADVLINELPAERWRRHRYEFLAKLVEADLTHDVSSPLQLQPEGEAPIDIPEGMGDQIQPLLDNIKALAAGTDPIDWPKLYRATYDLVRRFMSTAPGLPDQIGNHQIAALNENIDHIPKLAELCEKFDKQARTISACTEAESYKALSDVMYAGQKEVLVRAQMSAKEFLPLAMLARNIRKLLEDFRQSQKAPVAEGANAG